MITKDDQGWIAPIDGLRAIAALTVVVGHLMAASWGISWPTASMAVAVFFGISGFLIFYLFEREFQRGDTIDLRRYFLRRILRIWPLYFSVVVIGLALALYGYREPRLVAIDLLGLATFTTNIWMAEGTWYPPGLDLLWTICIEEQFYLLAPLMFAITRTRWRWAALALGTAAAIIARYGYAARTAGQIGNSGLYYISFSYFETFAFSGMAGIAFVRREHLARWLVHPAALPLYLAALWIVGKAWGGSTSPPYTWYSPLIYTGLGLVIAPMLLNILVNGRTLVATALSWPPLRFLGALSYSIYATQYFVYDIVSRLFPGIFYPVEDRPTWLLLVVLPMSIAISFATWRFIETPFLRLKARLARPLPAGRARSFQLKNGDLTSGASATGGASRDDSEEPREYRNHLAKTAFHNRGLVSEKRR